MNNKGFTMVELVGIVLILSLVFLVSFPLIQDLTQNDIDKSYDVMVNNLCLAGNSYLELNQEERPTEVGNSVTISVSDLISDGFIDSDIQNQNDINAKQSLLNKKN